MRTSGLKAIHKMPYLKLKEAKDVRWLSHDQAVQTLRRCLAAVLIALEREATENLWISSGCRISQSDEVLPLYCLPAFNV